MIKYKLYILLAIVTLLAGCNDDPDPIFNGVEGNIENIDGTRFSVFHLLGDGISNWETENDVSFELVDPVSRESFTFKGSILRTEEGGHPLLTCRLKIGETEIPNGTYYVSITGSDLSGFGLRTVKFFNNVGMEQEVSPMEYSDLEGKGTQSDPYIISSQGDFLIMLSYLEDDDTHAYGKYFKQTRPFELPHRSQVIDGKVWAAVSFSGNYDGGGFRLNKLTYQGSSDSKKDSGIGLFKDLYCASISNVNLTEALITHAASNVGLIAGSASGSCKIENVSIDGTIIASGENIGGLIGSVNGDLNLVNVSIGTLSISESTEDNSNVGGLIGSFRGGSLKINSVTTPTHIFSVSGDRNIGGLVGMVSDLPANASVTIDSVTLEHSVDQESADVKIVNGDIYVGGLIGMVSNVDNISLSSVSLKCPVTGRQDIGAVFGHVASQSNMSIDGCVLSSVVKGQITVGGFFGYLSFRNSNGSLTFKGAKSRYVVKTTAAAGVTGHSYVGALAGYLEGSHGKIKFDTPLEIAVDVSGNEEVGGAVGYMNQIEEFNIAGLNFSSTTMKVEGSEDNVGGVVGKAVSSNLSGNLRLSLTTYVPDPEYMASYFSGVVNGRSNVGGIVGNFNGSLLGVSSDARVTATSSNAGVICGSLTGSAEHCASFGHVDGPEANGGIIGYSGGSVKVKDCLNSGDITTGKYAAGILARATLPLHATLNVSYCVNNGHISNVNCGGGIIGSFEKPATTVSNENVKVYYCKNKGNVRGKGDSSYSIAGILGECMHDNLRLYKCANYGNISSSGVQFVIGGVAGELGYADDYNWIFVYECMNSGTISCDNSETKLGGVVGHLHYTNLANQAQVHDCYNTGDIPSDQKSDTGGIIGYVTTRNDIFRTFNRGKISHGNATIGTHKSGTIFYHDHNYYLAGTGGGWPSSTSVASDKISDKSVYEDFDFNNVWEMTSDGPALRDWPF